MNDPNIHSSTWDWDTASTSAGLEALPQLPAPHVHERRRQGQGRRLRDHARRPQAGLGAALPRPARRQRPADAVLRVGRRAARPRPRGASARATKSKKELRDDLKGIRGKMGRQVVKDYIAFPALSAAARASRRRSPRTSPPTSSATSGPTRSSSAATSPTRRTRSPRRRPPTSPGARGTSASCSAPRTSTAATPST